MCNINVPSPPGWVGVLFSLCLAAGTAAVGAANVLSGADGSLSYVGKYLKLGLGKITVV